jgi:hypothetical protein
LRLVMVDLEVVGLITGANTLFLGRVGMVRLDKVMMEVLLLTRIVVLVEVVQERLVRDVRVYRKAVQVVLD